MQMGAASRSPSFAERHTAGLTRVGLSALGAILSSWVAWSGLTRQSSVAGSLTAPIAPVFAFLVDLGVVACGVVLLAIWPARRAGGQVMAFGFGGCLSMLALLAWLYGYFAYSE